MEVDDDIETQQQQTSRKQQRISSDKTGMRDWKNPSSRIIRVSRASGGKDRHSKVLTSKGLRDRRIRLSVATAIQFYDLQDRLGFDQPSKAVEWLINAASDSISELPPINTSFDQALSLSKSACSSGTSEGSLLSLSRTESRGKARERARERTAKEKDKDLQSSFTQLLTGGFDEPNRNWIGGSSSDCFNPVQLLPSPSSSSSLHHFNNSSNHRQEPSRLSHHQNHFSFVPDYNFGISSSDSPGAAAVDGGCYTSRGTLQSNSHSPFLNNSNNVNQRPISFMATPPPLDHQLPATFDGRLYLYYGEGNRSSDEKGKDDGR